MSKAIIFSDWHAHDYKMYSKNVNRLDTSLDVLDALGEFCDAYAINIILFSGDLFDTHKALLTQVINKTTARFKQFFDARPTVKFYAITGNHDQASKNLLDAPAVSAIDYLAEAFPNNFINIDNKVVEIAPDVIVSGIPYYEYAEHFDVVLDRAVEALNTVEHTFAYLLTHQTPKGIANDLIPTDCNPHDPRFKNWDYVFNGHIHKRQQLADNYVVVGSPIHRDLGDAGEKKGFYVMNIYKPETLKFIYLQGFPEFKEVYAGEYDADLEEDPQHYLVVKTRPEEVLAIKDAKVAEFSTDLKDQELVKNYWEEVDGKDDELLQLGLSFLT